IVLSINMSTRRIPSRVNEVLQRFRHEIEEVRDKVLKQCEFADPDLYVNLRTKDGHALKQLNCWMIFKKDFHKEMTNPEHNLYQQICDEFNIPGKERVHMVGDLARKYWKEMEEIRDKFKHLADRVKEQMQVNPIHDTLKRRPNKRNPDKVFIPFIE
ncbi:12176_t:CDS:1, partial [Racocetra fulgida]